MQLGISQGRVYHEFERRKSIDDILGAERAHIEDVVRGVPFTVHGERCVPEAKAKAIAHGGADGVVTMPELVAAKLKTDRRHLFWDDFASDWHAVDTDEAFGRDRKGRVYGKGTPVVVTVHGGLLTPERILRACREGLADGYARLSDDEFDLLLRGTLPDGGRVRFFDAAENYVRPERAPHRFGVVTPYGLVSGGWDASFDKTAFLANPLALARIGDYETMEHYFDEAADARFSGRTRVLGCSNPFAGRDPDVPVAINLCLVNGRAAGLSGGGSLRPYSSRYIGVRAD